MIIAMSIYNYNHNCFSSSHGRHKYIYRGITNISLSFMHIMMTKIEVILMIAFMIPGLSYQRILQY